MRIFILTSMVTATWTGRLGGQETPTAQDLIYAQISEFSGNTVPGKQIIDFSFPDLSGQFHSPLLYRGNVLLLWMIGYINDTSVASVPLIESVISRNRDRPVVMLALDLWNGSHAQLTNFRTLTGVTLPLLQNALSTAFPLAVDSSTMVVIDLDGIVQAIYSEEDVDLINRMVDLILDPAPVVEWGPKSLFYGRTIEVGSQLTITITIRNTGTLDLEVTDIQSDIPDLTFSRTQLTLPPRGEETVAAILTPSLEGILRGAITITTNDPAQGSVELPIEETTVEAGALPVIAIMEASLNFGDVEVGRSGTATITIRNDGEGPLQVTDLQSDVTGVSFSRTTFTVAANSSETVTVTIGPASEGAFAGSIQVSSSDPSNSVFSIPLQATGILTPADPRTDFNGNGTVDFPDFLEFAQAFGSTESKYDLNDNGTVDFADFLTFADSFGKPVG